MKTRIKKPIKNLATKTKHARQACLVLYGLGMALFFGRFLLEHGFTDPYAWGVRFLQWFPIMMLLPGLISGHPRNQVLLCFLLMFYFCFSVMHAFTPGIQGVLATMESVVFGALYTTAMMYTRWEGRTRFLAETAKAS